MIRKLVRKIALFCLGIWAGGNLLLAVGILAAMLLFGTNARAGDRRRHRQCERGGVLRHGIGFDLARTMSWGSLVYQITGGMRHPVTRTGVCF